MILSVVVRLLNLTGFIIVARQALNSRKGVFCWRMGTKIWLGLKQFESRMSMVVYIYGY
jgi:hypothetical protein